MPDAFPSPLGWRYRLAAAVMAAAFAALAPAGAAAQQIVAIVNGDPITAFDIENRGKLMAISNQKTPARHEVLEELIDEKVKLSVIKRYVMEVTDKEVE